MANIPDLIFLLYFTVYQANLVPNNFTSISANTGTRYLYSLYWAIVTVGTVGYGDIVAVSNWEKIVAIIVIMMGGWDDSHHDQSPLPTFNHTPNTPLLNLSTYQPATTLLIQAPPCLPYLWAPWPTLCPTWTATQPAWSSNRAP